MGKCLEMSPDALTLPNASESNGGASQMGSDTLTSRPGRGKSIAAARSST